MSGCQVSERESAKYITVHQSENFTIKIHGNHNTQYRWSLVSKPGFIDSVSYKYVGEGDEIGSGGMNEWTFKAKHTGKDSLTFHLNRMESQPQTIESRTFMVDVTK
jgi:predicted secreted protein